MKDPIGRMTRSTFLGGVVLLPALAAVTSTSARADDSKASKDSMRYQASPNGGKQCSGCKFFIPGASADADGTCQIVDGSISPHGYCMAYNAK